MNKRRRYKAKRVRLIRQREQEHWSRTKLSARHLREYYSLTLGYVGYPLAVQR